MSGPRILCILPLMTHPTIATRIDMMRERGFQVEPVTYERDFFHGRAPDFPVTSLGRIRNGHYLRRIPALVQAMRKIRPIMRRSDLVYVIGTDLAFAAYFAGLGLDKPMALEVLDIRNIQVVGGLKGRIVRVIDKFIVERCRLLVLVSAEYHRYFHDRLWVSKPGLLIEAKVERSRTVVGRGDESRKRRELPLVDRPLRIGYFSVVRDQWSLDFLERLIGEAEGKFQAVIAGAVSPGIRRFDQFLARNPEIEYRGEYNYPDDLPALYGSVDMSLACYPPVVPDCWSRSSRFYESAFYGRPLIVRAGTGDAAEVAQRQVGLVVKHSSPDDAAKEACAITADDWARWRANMDSLPSHVYRHTTEAEELDLALRGILRGCPS